MFSPDRVSGQGSSHPNPCRAELTVRQGYRTALCRRR